MSPAALSFTRKPWARAQATDLQGIKGVCLDIDDTLSTGGKLTGEAYRALWLLKDAGYWVVPITGRPAGWCDHIARFWPVDAVVGENGAFTFFMDQGVRKRLDTLGPPDLARAQVKELGCAIREKFTQAQWASDQAYREYDLAIDVCEDVPEWPRTQVDELLALCKLRGAHAKLSSVHVNAWFGEYDKRRGFEHWLEHTKHPANKSRWDQWIFIGDSPNDEPMFASFTRSVGVANLGRYLDRLDSPPTWITASESGKGFAEFARKLVSVRAKRKK